MTGIAESHVEAVAPAWVEALGYAMLHCPGIVAGEPAALRHGFSSKLAYGELRAAVAERLAARYA